MAGFEASMKNNNNEKSLQIKLDGFKKTEDVDTDGALNIYRKELLTFQTGLDNLKKGTGLLRQILSPTTLEMTISLFSMRLAERMRLKRLLFLDLARTQTKLIKKSDQTIKSLQKVINDLEKRYSQAHEKSQETSSRLENGVIELEKLKEKIRSISDQMRSIEVKGAVKNNKDLQSIKRLRKFNEQRDKERRLILEKEKIQAEVESLKAYASTQFTHSEYSFNMLKKLLPIKEIVSVNKEILLNRIDMLNKMIAAGTILKPLIEVSNDLNEINLQFADASAQVNSLMEEIKISYS